MNEITEPLRLATGTHQAGSGKGCAMNVISWENGDTVITDYPSCSARPLAKLVQSVNDQICRHAESGFLCPACSLTVLDLGHATTGTAGATPQQEAAWTAELLNSPEWGVTRLLLPGREKDAVDAVAALLKRRADGDEPALAEWKAVNGAGGVGVGFIDTMLPSACVTYAAQAAQAAVSSVVDAAAANGGAYTCGGIYDAPYYAAAAAATAAAPYAAAAHYAAAHYAANADAQVTACATAAYAAVVAAARAARAEHCRSAIAAWHRICGTAPAVPEPAVTEQALRAMSAK